MRHKPVTPIPAAEFDAQHELMRLVAYCDALQALADSATAGDHAFDYLTPFGFQMLMEPIIVKLNDLLEHYPTAA